MICEACEQRRKDAKTREQEERYHAMLGDVARQCSHLNERLDADSWKRLCVDQFRRECLKDPTCNERILTYWNRSGFRLIPSIDGTGLVALGDQTRKFPKYIANAFIEWLMAFGVDHDVTWSDPTRPPIEAYEQDVGRYP